MLDRLSRDKEYWVRYYVAKNPNALVEILTRLSRDKQQRVREGVDENPKWKAIEDPSLFHVAKLASKWLKIL